MDDLKQYGKRNALHSHNGFVPTGDPTVRLITDYIIIYVCKETFNIDITKDDIFLSHPSANPTTVVRLRIWKLKTKFIPRKKLNI